jgi:type IV pilus assembly protein PilA
MRATAPTPQSWGLKLEPQAMKTFSNIKGNKSGFSLVEATVVVVIFGVLAMMGVPRYQEVVERAKAAESFSYLAQIEGAQERHNIRTGEYAKKLSQLDVTISNPKHFEVGNLTSYNWQTQWELKLTRKDASFSFGAYSVTWSQDGFQRSRSSVKAGLLPVL